MVSMDLKAHLHGLVCLAHRAVQRALVCLLVRRCRRSLWGVIHRLHGRVPCSSHLMEPYVVALRCTSMLLVDDEDDIVVVVDVAAEEPPMMHHRRTSTVLLGRLEDVEEVAGYIVHLVTRKTLNGCASGAEG